MVFSRRPWAWASPCSYCAAQNAPTTERPEAVEAGTACLVGTDRAEIVAPTRALLDDSAAYAIMDASAAMAHAVNPYGDGHAGRFSYQGRFGYQGRADCGNVILR